MLRTIKFTYKISGKTLSLTYFQNKGLKKMDRMKKTVYPIYIQVNFNTRTQNLRSILWKRLIEGSNNFAASVRYGEVIMEGYSDVETYLIADRTAFEQICAYEADCINRIIVFALQSRPENVKQIAEAYDFWGQDGLREICSNIIAELTVSQEVTGLKTLGVVRRTYKSLSKNARNVITTLIEQNYDPVSVLCFIDEMDIISSIKKHLPDDLIQGFIRVMDLIGILISDLKIDHAGPSTAEVPFGIYYFPKIHFFYPLSRDFSSGPPRQFEEGNSLRSIDLLTLQKFLRKEP